MPIYLAQNFTALINPETKVEAARFRHEREAILFSRSTNQTYSIKIPPIDSDTMETTVLEFPVKPREYDILYVKELLNFPTDYRKYLFLSEVYSEPASIV